MGIETKNGSFPSADGKNKISYRVWADANAAPKAVLQISHGMAEHIGRYDALARFMAQNGFVVYGSDHLGHGASAASEDLGFFENKDGHLKLAADLRTLSDIAKDENKGLPLVLLGHSMGSFVARLYAALYPESASALIFSGTAGYNPAAPVGLALVNILAKLKGDRAKSPLIQSIAFGAYNSKIENPGTEYDWISKNPDNVSAYMDDPFSGFYFTLSGYRVLFSLLKEISSSAWASKLNKDVPVLLISGEEDPVGDYGKGVKEVLCRLDTAEVKDASLVLYENMRHEVLNETQRLMVFEDLLYWCKARLNVWF